MPDQGTISFTYHTTDAVKAGAIVVQAAGIDLDDALDLVEDALVASVDPVYKVGRKQVDEQVTRPGRDRKPRPVKAEPVSVAVGEPAQIRRVKITRDGAVDV